jgi:hypothetical protein
MKFAFPISEEETAETKKIMLDLDIQISDNEPQEVAHVKRSVSTEARRRADQVNEDPSLNGRPEGQRNHWGALEEVP